MIKWYPDPVFNKTTEPKMQRTFQKRDRETVRAKVLETLHKSSYTQRSPQKSAMLNMKDYFSNGKDVYILKKTQRASKKQNQNKTVCPSRNPLIGHE